MNLHEHDWNLERERQVWKGIAITTGIFCMWLGIGIAVLVQAVTNP